jgi:hypothetical protein
VMLVEVNPRERSPQPTTHLGSGSIQSPQGPTPTQAPEVPDRSRCRAALSRSSCAKNSYVLGRSSMTGMVYKLACEYHTALTRERGVIRCNCGTGSSADR